MGPNAWGYVLDHYADGAELHPDAVDVTELVTACEAFFAEAVQGSFGPAPEWEWNAEQVVAHVALNDAAMLDSCQALVHENPTRFGNRICQDLEVLAGFIESAGGMIGLIERGRNMADLVLASVTRLSPTQRETAVNCCLTNDGETMVDRPVRWESIAVATRAGVHLPAHTGQLRDLRT